MRPDLSQLDGRRFDVVIIGGGINGASAAQHLSAAGYRLLVVDKGDFASGASARSSRLLHCGLRYLAPGRSLFDFVRHPSRLATALRMARLAMDARGEFVRTSPARATAMALHFPIYRDGLYRGWQVDAAFALLKRLGGADVPLDYRRLSPDEARAHPLLGRLRDLDRLAGVAAFREYQFDWPERVALDAVLDAERLGATARNYTKARLCQRSPDGGWTVELTDMLAQSPPVSVHGALVLVMSGLWMDELLSDASRTARRKVFGTKGCHLVVKLPEGCAGSGIATFNSRNEPLYCLPWKDLHFVGPTETVYEGDPDRVSVSREEADDLLGEANRLLPGLRLTAANVHMSWAGVRPLTYDPNVPFGNRSRVIHDLAQDGLPDAFAMTAGPVMTHRSAGREMMRLVAQRLAPSRAALAPDYAAQERAGAEHAMTVADEIFRRSGTGWTGPVAAGTVAEAARALGREYGWSEDRVLKEQQRFEAEWYDLFAPPWQRQPAGVRMASAQRRLGAT